MVLHSRTECDVINSQLMTRRRGYLLMPMTQPHIYVFSVLNVSSANVFFSFFSTSQMSWRDAHQRYQYLCTNTYTYST